MTTHLKQARFKPYVLWRRGLLPFRALAALVPERTWALLAESQEQRDARQRLATGLCERLYQIAPSAAPTDRRRLLEVRRDIYNDRLPEDTGAATVERLLDADTLGVFHRWRRARQGALDAEAAAGAAFAEELHAARGHLADMATDEHFLRGVQLSGRHLYRSVQKYAGVARGTPPQSWSRHLRHTESTLVRYACRMALRTSPFGSFTEIGAQPWRSVADSEASAAPPRRRVQLNRGLLAWMAHELRHVAGSDRILLLRLNNTLRARQGGLEAFTRGADGGQHAYWGERFIDLRVAAAVAIVIEALGSGPQPRAETVRRLVGRRVPPQTANTFLDGLIAAGVCHQDLGLPDQVTEFATEAAARLRTVPTDQAGACAESFERLAGIETAFADAGVEQRERLIHALDDEVRRYAAVCGIPAPPEMARSLVFEDVAARQPARSWQPEMVERNARHFARLQRLLPLFDDGTFEKLGIYSWFASRFGPTGRCDDLLALYRAFAEQPAARISAIMQATDDPSADEVRNLRHRLLRRLGELVRQTADAPVLRLDEHCLEVVEASLPEFLPQWTEAAYRLQLAPAEAGGDALIVLNDVTTGHGVFFSRFCDLLDPTDENAWSLRRAVHDEVSSSEPRQADLVAALGLNVNLHPRLTPIEIVYPGSIAAGGGDVLTLRDVTVEGDPVRRALQLINRRDGRPLVLTPMNFLFPAAAPMLYRFLCALAPLHAYRLGVWDRLQRFGSNGDAQLPRLVLGDLVLERRRWHVPSAAVTELGDGASLDRLDTWAAVWNWQARHGLPRECFFRVHDVAEVAENVRDWMGETRRWALNARTARRKGQYLDFRNPFLVRLLLQQAGEAKNGVVVFQECLPPTSTYMGVSASASAEEFLVELRSCSTTGGETEA